MKHRRWLASAVLASTLGLTACSASSNELGEGSNDDGRAAPIKDSGLSEVSVTPAAYRRLAITTQTVPDGAGTMGTSKGGPSTLAVIPSAAVLYDSQGNAWTYVTVRPRTFVRTPVVVDHFDGDLAYVSEGPPPGAAVVTVGVQELFGIELGVEGE